MSVAEEPEASQQSAQQRLALFGGGLRRSGGGRRGGGGGLLGCSLLVRHGGAVVKVGVDEAAAASDVVDAAHRGVPPVRQGEAGLLFLHSADPFVAQTSVQNRSSC